MPSYLAPRNPYHSGEDGKFVCDGDDINKVSGTSMAGILGVSPWATPFTVSCNLLALAREDISDKDAVKVGIALEEKIIRYAAETYSDRGEFMTAEEVFQKREGDHDAWVSDFEDDHFAGHIDGIVTGSDGEDYILEVKTSSNLDSWAEGVPEYYYWQVALYNHFLTQQDKAYVLLGIVNENTYRDPASWIPSTANTVLYEISIDTAAVAEKIEEVRAWYNENIVDAKSTTAPDLDNPKDHAMHEHLSNIGQSVDSVKELLDKLAEVSKTVDEYDAVMAEKRFEEQKLRDQIKDYMVCNGLSELPSGNGSVTAKIVTRSSKRFAEERMVADGIDPAKYKTVSMSKSLNIKTTRE